MKNFIDFVRDGSQEYESLYNYFHARDIDAIADEIACYYGIHTIALLDLKILSWLDKQYNNVTASCFSDKYKLQAYSNMLQETYILIDLLYLTMSIQYIRNNYNELYTWTKQFDISSARKPSFYLERFK